MDTLSYLDMADICRLMRYHISSVNGPPCIQLEGDMSLGDKSHDAEISAALLSRMITSTWPDMPDALREMVRWRLMFAEWMMERYHRLRPNPQFEPVLGCAGIVATCTVLWHRRAGTWLSQQYGIGNSLGTNSDTSTLDEEMQAMVDYAMKLTSKFVSTQAAYFSERVRG